MNDETTNNEQCAAMAFAADECTAVYRMLADSQNVHVMLDPRQVERIVTACCSAANAIDYTLGRTNKTRAMPKPRRRWWLFLWLRPTVRVVEVRPAAKT